MTDKMISILQKFFWPMIGGAIVAILVSLVWGYKQSQELQKIEKEQDEFFVIRKDVEKIALSLEPKAEIDDKKKPAKKDKTSQVSPEAAEKAYAEVAPRLMAFVKANQGSPVAVEAALLLSEITSEYKKYEVGIEALSFSLQGFNKSPFLFAVGQSELGNLFEKSKKCAQAIEAWAPVLKDKQATYLSSFLRLKSGICSEKENNLDQAEKFYQEVVDKEATSSSGRLAKKFLLHIRYLKAKATSESTANANNG